MLYKIGRTMKSKKGFTLVELMVVVVIIGILVAIAVPIYNSATDRSNQAAVEANLRTIDGAIMMYQSANNGANPTAAQLTGTYLQAWPAGPADVVYAIAGGQATATSAAGGFSMVATTSYTLSTLPW